MLGLKFIEENPDIVKKAVKNKGESADIDRFLELRKEWRKTL